MPPLCRCGCKNILAGNIRQHIQYCEDPQLHFTRWNTRCIIILFIRHHILELLTWPNGQQRALDILIAIKNRVEIRNPGRTFCEFFFGNTGETVRNAPLDQKDFEFLPRVLTSFSTAFALNFQDIRGFYPICNCPANCNRSIAVGGAYRSHGATMYQFYSQACIMQIFIETGEIPAHPEATALLQDAITIYDARFIVTTVSETFFSRIMNEDVAYVLRSFKNIEELKLAMNLIYDRNITPNSRALVNRIFTSVDHETLQARIRVASARHRMTVAYNTPAAVMMRRLRDRLYSMSRYSSKYNQSVLFSLIESFLTL